MDNKITLGIIVLAIILVGGYLIYTSGPTVAAEGNSAIKVMPDEVSVYINVETFNSTAQLAAQENAQISEKLLSALVIAGFDRNDLKFINYNVYPEYNYDDRGIYSPDKGKIVGYHAYQQLVVKTNDTSKVPSIVTSAINSGALVSYINFELSDSKQREYKQQALQQASEDAKLKAKSIADGQGKHLGRLISLSNQDFRYGGPIAYYSAGTASSAADIESFNVQAKSAAMNINPQDTEVYANINAVYKIGWF